MTVVCVCKVSIKNTTCGITDIGKVKAFDYMINLTSFTSLKPQRTYTLCWTICTMLHIELRVKTSSKQDKRRDACLSQNRERDKKNFHIMIN